ncbi:protein IQ-DOMAIN 14 isoform X2 [Abrus precatorius]|uniref:Protein IQ-DOMAIN 14 isoform X2 n=1 Tax=Abrus precatorius TaxID=3816 RepID=A0A8B8KP83_ABRPR|nr:protein IQ-DOMAIN 14 isoform X2 [Abrus precatorius]XP_027345660.1 protein IQ-DOMAIN 14 isoform X2 [Abrus precatorius]XP_027345661.1 protein IQ-DOMAIN 14 isoform X2 [Abrus precatorius]XP_027345663.1 protein IQ-DOMAIN 14 isoform X2 [Abrus precatorius]XP_027345664.1 protein IQ-DOMAIN 14 isoform X2 [Abrus precatorius]
MGKKGSWFSAIKRVFTHYSKGKDSDNKGTKEKKKGLGKLKHGETNSFIPLFREPSSIEKIFGDFEREQQLLAIRPPTPPERPKTPPYAPPRAASPRAPSPRGPSPRPPSPRVASPRASSPRVTSPKAAPSRIVHHHKEVGYRPEPTLRNQHASATKIQAAYRGYMARRSFRALKGLVRLQGVVRGQNVKRQTVNAMKHMQLLVRVQSQIQSRRIQMLENQARYQAEFKNDKEAASTLGKLALGHGSEAGHEEWDDSLLTKEEIEARLQRKVEAIIKRERAMAFAYSHQLWKATPKSTHPPVTDMRSGGFPWWWNWLEKQLPAANPQEKQVLKSFQLTPPRPYSEQKTSPRPGSSTQRQQSHFAFDNMDTPTPKSTKSTILTSSRPARTPPYRTPQANSSGSKYQRPRSVVANSPFDVPLKDDDSLTSCPPFSVPNYMAPTLSAKAKVRASSNPRERFGGTPTSTDSKRRLSFPLAQGIGSFKWSKGFSSKDQGIPDKFQSLESIGNVSVDSTVSLPARVGRKPFTRFV